MNDSVVINFEEWFKSMREGLYFKLGEDKNLRKVAQLLYNFSTTPDEKEKYVELLVKNGNSK